MWRGIARDLGYRFELRELELDEMLRGVVLISIFTAAMTSSLTVGQLQGPVHGPEDLAAVRVAAIENSTSAA